MHVPWLYRDTQFTWTCYAYVMLATYIFSLIDLKEVLIRHICTLLEREICHDLTPRWSINRHAVSVFIGGGLPTCSVRAYHAHIVYNCGCVSANGFVLEGYTCGF
jgi:hypothetical protein